MAVTSKPTAVWFGDTQLTGAMPYAFQLQGLSQTNANNRQSVQYTFFNTVCTEKPAYKTPVRRVGSVHLPNAAGSHRLTDYGYDDTTQSYKFAWNDSKYGGWMDLARYYPILMRRFEEALTGTHYVKSFVSPYCDGKARWNWLVDTFDNPLAVGPRPALNIIGPDDVIRQDSGVIYARQAIYDGGDDITTQYYRYGTAQVTFKVKPRLYRLRQSIAVNPTFVDPDNWPVSQDDKFQLRVKGKPVLLIQWTGTKQLVRTSSSDPMSIVIARNNFMQNGCTLSYRTGYINGRLGGTLGIGFDYLREEAITGPMFFNYEGLVLSPGSFLWTDETQDLDFWIGLRNCHFEGDGDVYVSAIYAEDSYVV